MRSFQRTKIYQKCVVFPLNLQIEFSTTTVVNSLALRKGAQLQNAIVPPGASNYFQIVFWGIFYLCLLENELFAGSLHSSINEKCHSYESFLEEWKRFFMRQTQRKKISYKIVAHAMNPHDTHAPVQKTRGTGTTWARHTKPWKQNGGVLQPSEHSCVWISCKSEL